MNRDGSIDRAEVGEIMDDINRKTGLPRLSDEALDEELAALDTDSSGTLDVVEYRAFVRRAL